MHRGADADADEDIYYDTAQDAQSLVQDGGQPPDKGCVLPLPRLGLPVRTCQQGLDPGREVAFEPEPAQHESPDRAEQQAAGHVDECGTHPERSEQERYGDLVHQRGGDQEGEGDAERDTSLDESDEEGDRRTGAEGGDGSEQCGEQVLQAEETPVREKAPQAFDREVGIDDPHGCPDDDEQQDDLYGVVEKEMHRGSETARRIESEEVVDEPCGKAVNHVCRYFEVKPFRGFRLRCSRFRRGSCLLRPGG